MFIEIEATVLWFIVGLALILLEFIIPGVILIFFGMGAMIVALGMWVGLIESVATQCIVFSISSLLMLFLLRRYVSFWFVGDTSGDDSNVEEEFVGKKVKVVRPIGGGDDAGKVELKGAEWIAYADEPLDVGRYVTVIRRNGIELIVRSNS